MNRELYGALIGALTLLALALPISIFTLVVAFLALLIGRELSFALGVESVFPATFFSSLLFVIDPALGGIYVGLIALAYGYRTWNLDSFLRSVFILFYTGFFTSYLVHIREMGFTTILAFVLSVWANDVFAYYIGKRYGKAHLLPKLSPKKTVEGFLGGIAAGALAFALLSPFPLLKSLLIAVLFLLAGVAGDYFKSFIKRQLGIKDFSHVLGGHGGFTDRFDAVIFAAPVFYWLTYRL
ncbi:phosphatidate cytidylyltransferase [Hydrogenivirga caldilitoris]|uniref:Phosphatidate cytidylyltransferase n=1 Tax=Hydrogenivirga caldilitoris TaxID=246264 RepID=A0A497XRN2_9AQUI|nr:phosphatidate cytidylyltransferase [Hydrogenivirga caldilitoris]RLJ70934.1 phosphatidate cytidylyltransferase [Hydrogenivirga caldilitoris]